MATLKNPLFRNYHGHIDKLIVVKQYADKTVLTAYPDMSRVIFSDSQVAEQNRFKEAVAYARSIIADPQQKAAYQVRLKPGKRVYNAAIAEFMRKPVPERPQQTRVIWIADAAGSRVFACLSSLAANAAIEEYGRGLLRLQVIPRSVKGPFERRITEPGTYELRPHIGLFSANFYAATIGYQQSGKDFRLQKLRSGLCHSPISFLKE